MLEAAAKAAKGGADALQVREKGLGGKELYELCADMQKTLDEKATLVINDRVDVAMALSGAGAHLPGSGLSLLEARKLMGTDRLLGKSVHSIDEARRAERDGADYIIFGPVYDTESKRSFGGPQGLDKLSQAASGVKIPVYAIGGIVPERASEVRKAGAAGMAVMSFILDHPDPEEAARQLVEAWQIK